MSAPSTFDAQPARLRELLDALPGLDRIAAAAGGAPTYLVGGAVRDLLLGRERTDLDVVVEGDAAALAAKLGGESVADDRFATAKAVLDGVEFDLATARAESYPHPGALPEVRPASVREDLARRDFSINAMAVPIGSEPELIDPHGGLADLEAGVLRVLHERSFVDDPTRALRAARYAARFDFAAEPETEAMARRADLSTVSEDRVESELMRLAREPRAGKGFELLAEWSLVELPPEGARLIDTVEALLERPPWAGTVDRALAVHAAATGRAPGAAGRVHDLLAGARELAGASPARPSEAVALASGRGEVELLLARALDAGWLDRYLAEWRDVRLEITGEDLIEAGVPEGPGVGRGLEEALRRKLDGEISGRDDELRVALGASRS
jgi:tRNA nucleotidyltransferase (CCA-adding enzyme)